ncbi:Hsp20/alpha crystallin family protein [Candidatus Parcubacteria bacterium]|nr:Hsp20/alpha crystallin family protein [Candidatus Parcubacteria bacterium]
MALIKWTPFLEPFEEMDNFFSNFPAKISGEKSGFFPAVDMYEKDNNLIVETELIGIEPEKVNISIENNILSIKGESEKKTEVDDKNYYRKEIKRGSFFRNIQLPTMVDGDSAEAITEGGVLKITIPKKSENKIKTIKIKNKK